MGLRFDPLIAAGGLAMAGMVFAAAVVPELAHERTEHQRNNCARTLNILGRGCLLYSADWDETLPADRWLSSVANIHYIGEVIKTSGAHTTIQNSVKDTSMYHDY